MQTHYFYSRRPPGRPPDLWAKLHDNMPVLGLFGVLAASPPAAGVGISEIPFQSDHMTSELPPDFSWHRGEGQDIQRFFHKHRDRQKMLRGVWHSAEME